MNGCPADMCSYYVPNKDSSIKFLRPADLFFAAALFHALIRRDGVFHSMAP